MKTKSSLIGLSLTLVTLSLSSNAFSYEDSFERTQDKIADAAHSAAETASQIASETQSA